MGKEKIGVVLGGGGVRGFAHLGVLKALEEEGIRPDMISAVSAGAIAGVLIAEGRKPEEIMELMRENKFTDYAKANIPVNGLLSLDNLKENLAQELMVESFSDLELPFYVAVSDLYSGEVDYLNEGSLVTTIQASSSIPVLFSPVEMNDRLYVDGGLLDNLSIAPLLDRCDKIIVINVMPIGKDEEIDNLVDIATRTFQLSVSGNNKQVKSQADLFIEPPGLEKFHMLETGHADEIFEIGYNHCRQLDIKL